LRTDRGGREGKGVDVAEFEKQKLRSAKICQWNAAMGRQSSRAAAEAR
jgi:hypothetical protein